MSEPAADGILVAQLHGTARRHADRWWGGRELTEAGHDAAVAELRELAAGRADLLAHVAGILLGTGEADELFELRGRRHAPMGSGQGRLRMRPGGAGGP
jgi:hypothetical protein